MHQDGLTAASYAPDTAQICLVHTFYKADLLAALRQALPTGGVTVCDITEWISRSNVAAQMMVHSMLDAGKLLADLYSKCPQLARGATVLTVYGEHIAAVKQLLYSCLSDVHEDPELLQRIAHLETQVYRQISDALWDEGSCISKSNAFSSSHLLAATISDQHRAWLAAGSHMLQSRHRQHQQNTAARAQRLQASWNAYQAQQLDNQRAYEQTQATYARRVQAVHNSAASLLDDCRALAARQRVPAEDLAGSVTAVYAEASRRFPLLQQIPLLTAVHGFEEVQDRLVDIRLQTGSAGFRNVTLFVEEGGVLMVPDSYGIRSVQQKCLICTTPGSNTANCVVLDSNTFKLVITIQSSMTFISFGKFATGQASRPRPVHSFNLRMDTLSKAEHELKCEAGQTVRLHCRPRPGLRLAEGTDISGKIAINFLFGCLNCRLIVHCNSCV